jgi:peptidoglycan/xylan/chitin deacetylase (PgdA/CDA1 family)
MASNIAKLRTGGWKFGGQKEIANYLGRKSQDRICIITFDDGLKEQMVAFSDLRALDVPVLFFVSTAPVIEQRVLDVHKLHLIRSVTTDEELGVRLDQRFGMAKYQFDDALVAAQYCYDDTKSARVKYYLNFVLEPELRDGFVSGLFSEIHGDERAASQALYMSKEDWRFLASQGCLGTHGHRHLPLATLTDEGIYKDISESITALRECTGRPPIGIAYPYGGETAVSDSVYQSAIQLGLSFGFTMRRGVNLAPESGNGAMQLQRIDVNDLPSFTNSESFEEL